MQIEKKFVFAALVFASTILWIFFANASGFSLQEALFVSKYKETIATVLSPNFLLAIILFPLPFAIAAIATKKIEKKFAHLYCTLAAVLATIACLALFKIVAEHALIFAFYLVSFPLVIESADLGFKELKRFIIARAAGNAVKKANLLIMIALFIASSLIVMNSAAYVKDFEDSIISMVAPKETGFDVSELSTTLIIQAQKQSLETIMALPQFQKLREKQDNDVLAFVALIDALNSNIDSPEYKQTVLEQVKKNQSQLTQGQGISNIFELIKKQFPMFEILEKYLWLLYAITIVSIQAFIAGIIIVPLTMLYAIIIDKLIPQDQQATANKP